MTKSEPGSLRPEQSGVYRVPRGLPALRKMAESSGCTWLEVDLHAVRDKAGFLQACARALRFPPHFGANWDAFSDCINDLAWRPADGYVVEFNALALFARQAPDDAATALEILRAAAEAWRARHKIFIVLLDAAPPAAAIDAFPEPPPA